MAKLPKWKNLRRAYPKEASEDLIKAVMELNEVNREEALELLDREMLEVELYINDIYQVEVRRYPNKLVQINIRRRDGGPILRDWRHFQQIKNEIVGPEIEAVELYPAESRLVDTSNKYHLWAIDDKTYKFPFGFQERDVNYQERSKDAGLRQRPLTMDFGMWFFGQNAK